MIDDTKRAKRPRDTNQLAKFVVDVATGEAENDFDKNPNQRKGGKLGGRIRAQKLSPEQRSEIARAAALTRWKKRN